MMLKKTILYLILTLFCFKAYAGEQCINLMKELRKQGIRDEKVLDAIEKVARDKFIPDEYKEYACLNRPLPIDEDQTISQPYIVAYMTEALKLKPEDKVLEIGTGSGYQAAILAELVKEVYSVEIIHSLAQKSEKLLKELGYTNIHVRHGDGFYGWPEEAPFNAIIVTAAPEKIPDKLIEQLADRGKLILPVGDRSQKLRIIRKKGDKIVNQELLAVRFVPMTGQISK